MLSGVLRMKAAAILLGPAGIGLISLLTAVIAAASTVLQLGMGVVGPRQIAEAHASGDEDRVAVSWRAMLLATIALSFLGGVGIWLIRAPLAEWTVGSAPHPMLVLALAISVGLTVASCAQMALLQGMRRTKDLALLSVLSASAATLVGVALLWFYQDRAIPLFVMAAPACGFAVGIVIVGRLPRPSVKKYDIADLLPHWMMYVRLGIPYMAASMVQTGADLLIRMDIRTQLGLEMLGQFQASWSVAAQTVALALVPMAAEYYPRLAGFMSRPQEAAQLVNQQNEMTLLLMAPIIMAMFGWGPEFVALLYSSDFSAAGDLLHWQAVAQLFKVMSWPLGFVLLAAGSGSTFFLAEFATVAVMVVLTHILLGQFGLVGAGVAYLFACMFYLIVIVFLANRRLKLAWSRGLMEITVVLSILFGLLIIVLVQAPGRTAAATFMAVAAFSAFAARHLHRIGLTKSISRRLFGKSAIEDNILPG